METSLGIDLLGLAAVIFLVLANGFFVAAEFSLVRVRSTRIAESFGQGNRTADWVKRAIDDPDRFIAATQLGSTLSSLALGWIGEPALLHLLKPIVQLFPIEIEETVSRSVSAALAFTIITFLHVVVGELAPKSIALQSPERTSLIVAKPTAWVEWIFKPAIWLLNGAGNALLRLLNVEPASSLELAHSAEELKMLATASAESGIVKNSQEEMLHAVFDFGETLVRHVTIPRTEMASVPAQAKLEEVLQIAIERPYTKFPVYETSLDHIVGVVHLKDLVRALRGEESESLLAKDIMRDVIFVPEAARLDDLLNRFRSLKRHIAIVLDEYGGTAGVVTLEDLLEEIVGEVSDPFDDEPEIDPLPDGSSSVDGLTLIDDVNEYFQLHLSDPHYDTIAGYIMGRLGRIAQIGDTIYADAARMSVTAMDGLRIARVKLSLTKSLETAPPSERTNE